MNPDIEKLLLAKAAQEAQQQPSLGASVALGSGGGALLGGLLATPAHMVGKGIGSLRGTNAAIKPGLRMAGGLVGMLVGGGLGAGLQQQALSQPGPAGALLAKIQSQGGMSPQDQVVLEQVLRDAYTQQGLLG